MFEPQCSSWAALGLVAFALVSCAENLAEVASTDSPNVLVIVLDDVGVDRIGAYNADSKLTPNIDGLAARGVIFSRAWATPLCTPTRAAIQTGRYGFRTGIGTVGVSGLPTEEVTLAELLDAGTAGRYATAAIGKWHMGGNLSGGAKAANVAGYDHFAGTLGNLTDYFEFKKVVDGRTETVKSYATSDQTTDALNWIRQAPEPWFCYLAFNAVHRPLHNPPPRLTPLSARAGQNRDPGIAAFESMIEALDTEVGRLLDGLGAERTANTNIILLSDNGTHREQTVEAGKAAAGKGSVHESGILVPFMIAGPGVREPGRSQDALIGVTDIFATVADWAGVDLEQAGLQLAGPLDSVSLLPYLSEPDSAPLRESIFSECFRPNGPGPYSLVRRAVREDRYKLVHLEREGQAPKEHLYDMLSDPKEERDLLRFEPEAPETQAAHDRLSARLRELLEP